MPYEIDFLAVGKESKSGDAIALRWGDLVGGGANQTVVVIDGGTKESGEALVEHVRIYYRADHADIVVSTHADADHASGLTVVLEKLRVGQLLMHRPWEHAGRLKEMFANPRLTPGGLRGALMEALANAYDLEAIAKRKGIPIAEPFAGMTTRDGALLILGPTVQYYNELVANFRETPPPRYETGFGLIAEALAKAAEAEVHVSETAGIETLNDLGETSAENNSSVIALLRSDGDAVLLTGDAGIPALTQAADYASMLNVGLGALAAFQVPHHGSRRNIGPTLLNRIASPINIISAAPKGGAKHPSQRVVNAILRRGRGAYSTQGETLRHSKGAPARPNWRPATALPFVADFEE